MVFWDIWCDWGWIVPYYVLCYVWCLAFGFCRRPDVYLILTFTCLQTVGQSQFEKSCTPLLWRQALDLCFQVLCFQWLGGGTDCCKPDNITEQSNNLLHCNYSSVQRWTTTGCSHCRVCILVSWKLFQHTFMFLFSRELAGIYCMLSNA